MSRTTGTFGQLVGYCEDGMSRDDERFTQFHNMYPGQREQIVRDFLENANIMKSRKNGVQMYHEILSLSRSPDLSNEEQKEILQEVVREYLGERAPECMAYSTIHDEKDNNIHAHIVISANLVDSPKRHRLSKHDFEKVKQHTEQYVLDNHPEMQQGVVINKKAKQRVSKGESELKRRGGRTTKKDQLHDQLHHIFEQVSSQTELEKALADNGLAMSYRNGKGEPRFGAEDSKRHYRLNTLGLDTQYQQMADRFETNEVVNDRVGQEGLEPENDTQKPRDTKKANPGAPIPEKATSGKDVEPRTGYKSYPWEADSKERQREAQKQAKKPKLRERVNKATNEWLKGDFTERDKEATKAKYKKQNEADRKVKSRKEQTAFENISEDLKEFITGDFSNRDARKRKEKHDEIKKASKTVKDVKEQSTKERVKEKFNEYVKGDFKARDARAMKAIDEKLKEKNFALYEKTRNDGEKKAQEEWVKEDKTREFIEEKIEAQEKARKANSEKSKERQARFSEARSPSHAGDSEKDRSGSNGRDKGERGR